MIMDIFHLQKIVGMLSIKTATMENAVNAGIERFRIKKGEIQMKIIPDELVDCISYKENERLYLRLEYEIEKEDGVHKIIYPKVGLPENIMNNMTVYNDGIYSRIIHPGDMIIYPRNVEFEGKLYENVRVLDYLKTPKVRKAREMTLKEIENELGYSVKVISKEEHL